MASRFRKQLDWEDIHFFTVLARHRSLSAAARVLSVNHATVSRRVSTLEKVLGEKLVDRRPDGYVLTCAGRRIVDAAYNMENQAELLRRGGADTSLKGLVRVHATPTLIQCFLAHPLADLARRHEALDIEVVVDVRPVSLERHEADIALRFSRPDGRNLIIKSLAKIGYGFYASKEWSTRLSKGEPPIFVGYNESYAHMPSPAWFNEQFPTARVAFRSNSQRLQADAARAGAGIALIPHFLGRADEMLTPCSFDVSPPSLDLWLVTRRQDSENPVVKVVIDCVTTVLHRNLDILGEVVHSDKRHETL
ncbi:LysR family transcriptional regulator [Paraburkholderia solisilvae]|uniref:HTH-type transcriptional regulator HdfR n=1 Tax=Paraburkholderia solisilvae TaxID=624376 RepID=A0A6J5EJU9_9BURK|nr:LysR family transcriptional regulator [Paraburkholderia solisilvae]CAB3765265.1 HTH-type transcriptional regulator HdfR [Paraburkholderia solisilvae]